MRLKVGDVWLASLDGDLGFYYVFEIIAEVRGKSLHHDDQPFWIGVKQRAVDQSICFDERGRGQEAGFQLYSKSRSKMRIQVG